jgi:hypothetical protein
MANQELVKTQAAQVPAYIKQGDARGTENITSKDVRFPALKLAQGTSKEVKRQEAKFIEGLREGEFFNSAHREIYGEGPIDVVFVKYVGHRNIEYDKVDRNVVLDGNVPDGDPRTQFTERTDENGKRVRVKPAAARFEDYLIVYQAEGQEPEIATMSLKGTQLKKATDINTQLRYAGGSNPANRLPSFALKFKVTAVPESGGGNSWYGWKITRDGFPSEALFLAAEDVYNKTLDKVIKPEDDDAGDGGGAGVKDDDIPF